MRSRKTSSETVQSSSRDWNGDENEVNDILSPSGIEEAFPSSLFSGSEAGVTILGGSWVPTGRDDCEAEVGLSVEDSRELGIDLALGLDVACFLRCRLLLPSLE